PIVAAGDTTTWGLLAAWAALIAALPVALVFVVTLPQTVELTLGRRGRRASRVGTAAFALAAAVWVLAPGITAAPGTQTAVAAAKARTAAQPAEQAALGVDPAAEPGVDRWIERD